MITDRLNDRIISRGEDFFSTIQNEPTSVFNKSKWIGKVMDWAMKNEDFKVQLFRFVDVFPYLNTGPMLTAHIKEYFGKDEQNVPAVLKWGAKSSLVSGNLGASVLNKAIAFNMKEMAKQFIVGEGAKDTVKNLTKMRKEGFTFVIDILGEATVNEVEAEEYVDAYIQLLEHLKTAQSDWTAIDPGDGDPDLDWGHSPKVNIAVKPSGLYSQAKPKNFDGTVEKFYLRMKKIFEKVIEMNGYLCIDMESYKFKEITIELFKRLKLDFPDYPYLGVVLQSYLKETDEDLNELISWAKEKDVHLSIRLVKGAYWDYETVLSKQMGWENPLYLKKAESDAAFERHAGIILKNHERCHLACASHNIRSISAVMEMAEENGAPENAYEFQVLYGMAEPVRKGLRKIAKRIRLYAPYGEMIPGMAYLVRRLLENTSNDSFLKQTFADGGEVQKLLKNPVDILAEDKTQILNPKRSYFINEPMVDFKKKTHREAFPHALFDVRKKLGKKYALYIDNKEIITSDTIDSLNPNKPSEVIGTICQAGVEEIDNALKAAKAAFPIWRDTPPEERAQYLIRGAQIMRERIFEYSAWQVLEVGKQWDQAYADLAEAIDFLDFYAKEMIRLGTPKRMGNMPGEINLHFYEPKGIAAVISPWNFPLAISAGMVSAAIVTGNTVIFKPSSLSSVIGHHLVEVFKEVGLPPGVFNYTPGRSRIMGDYLVEHKDISMIAFTGSMDVGLRIIEKAARVQTGQANVKKVVCEMGGKNAIIVDDDANLDEVVPGVLYAAFGFQGQKCSACSRVIVLDPIYDKFIDRLQKGAAALKLGTSEDPANFMGAVVDSSARDKILEYIEIGRKEGNLIYQSEIPEEGYYIPITVFDGVTPEHRIAQEEIFGPVLSVMRVQDFDQAIEWANSTRFALTGGVYSRSPDHLNQARRDFRVGNLYLNRHNTGALVYRQPFGGAKMSGAGTKAGGPDYLLNFMDPRLVSENTMRRGFTPIAEDDDWGD